jgi:hypothetical protein
MVLTVVILALLAVAPTYSDDTSTFIGAAQDVHAVGMDHLTWYDTQTVGWWITGPARAQGFPDGVDEANIDSGTEAVSTLEPVEICYDILSFIQSKYQPNIVVEYKYKNRNQRDDRGYSGNGCLQPTVSIAPVLLPVHHRNRIRHGKSAGFLAFAP